MQTATTPITQPIPEFQVDQKKLQAKLKAEQQRLLYNGFSRLAPMALITLGVATIMLWGNTPVTWLGAWISGLLTLLGVRYGVARHLLYTHQQYWLPTFLGGILLTGGVLATGTIVLVPLDAPIIQAPLYALLVGCVISSAAAYASSLPVAASFSLSCLGPLSLYLLLNSAFGWATVFLFLMVFSLFSAWQLNRLIIQTLKAKLQNQELAGYLERQNEQSATLNQRLLETTRQQQLIQQELKKNHDELEQQVTERTEALTSSNLRLNRTLRRQKHTMQALQEARERLDQAMEASELGWWDWDLSLDKIYHTRMEKLTGYSSTQLQSFCKNIQPKVHPEDLAQVQKTLLLHLHNQAHQYIIRYRLRTKNGQWLWLEDHGQTVAWNKSGYPCRMVGTRRNITKEKESEQQTRLAATLFENNRDGVFIMDSQFRLLTVNHAFSKITGFTADQILQKNITKIAKHRYDRAKYRLVAKALKQHGSWQGELSEYHQDGSNYPVWLQIRSSSDHHGKQLHYVGTMADLSVHKKTEAQLHFLAGHDLITGLANRQTFIEQLQNMLQLAQNNGRQVTLVLFNIDRFRHINESFGYDMGDELLRELAKQIITVQADLIARLSGDEFALAVTRKDNQGSLDEIAQPLFSMLDSPLTVIDKKIHISISAGICSFPDQSLNLSELISHATLALAQAKSNGGNNYRVFKSELQMLHGSRLQQEQELRQALQNSELEVFYQPKLSLKSGKINAAEALVRWRHAKKGMIHPDEFIGLAEDVGLINNVGQQVLEQSIKQIRCWLDQNIKICVSVNLSAAQLRDSELLPRLTKLLQAQRVPPALLELELTESLLMEDQQAATQILNDIRKAGIKISIDDFGTGYSSLSYLKHLPVDAIKIDRSFIKDIVSANETAAIPAAIIAMAHSMDLYVVAEGVETSDHVDFLQKHHCDAIQGYYLSRPLTATEFSQKYLSQEAVI